MSRRRWPISRPCVPDWRVCVGREVTKTFEEFRHGEVAALAAEMATEKLLGECTLVVAPPVDVGCSCPAATTAADTEIDDLLRSLLAQGVSASTLTQALRALPGDRSEPGVRPGAGARSRAPEAVTITRVTGKQRTAVLAPAELAELRRAVREDLGRRGHRRRPVRVPPRVGRPGSTRDRSRRARRADG